jgi:hypothetical protein
VREPGLTAAGPFLLLLSEARPFFCPGNLFSTAKFRCPTLIPGHAEQAFDSSSDFAACLFSRRVSLGSRSDLPSPVFFVASEISPLHQFGARDFFDFRSSVPWFSFRLPSVQFGLGAQARVTQGFFPPPDFIAAPGALSAPVRSACFPLVSHGAAGQISLSGFLFASAISVSPHEFYRPPVCSHIFVFLLGLVRWWRSPRLALLSSIRCSVMKNPRSSDSFPLRFARAMIGVCFAVRFLLQFAASWSCMGGARRNTWEAVRSFIGVFSVVRFTL